MVSEDRMSTPKAGIQGSERAGADEAASDAAETPDDASELFVRQATGLPRVCYLLRALRCTPYWSRLRGMPG